MTPLSGIRVLELSSYAPTAFAGMYLADLGAEVIRIERPESGRPTATRDPRLDTLGRGGRRSLMVDLKKPGAAEVVLAAVATADVLIEGFRPGVTERLGIGPEAALARNDRLIYGRLTGWGQTGPYAEAPGHDINYLAVSGALYPMGEHGRPPSPPLNLIGDFAAGSMLVVTGILAALLARASSGKGQVVDAAMVDGCALITASLHATRASGGWNDERQSNLIDGAAPQYACYETADGGFLAVGAIEPKFRSELAMMLGMEQTLVGELEDRSRWPALRAAFAAAFLTRTRAEWMADAHAVGACVSPVLAPGEVLTDAHVSGRAIYADVDGVLQPAPAPRLSNTALNGPRPPCSTDDTTELLEEFGVPADRVAELRAAGAIA